MYHESLIQRGTYQLPKEKWSHVHSQKVSSAHFAFMELTVCFCGAEVLITS
jgi:hypothetical protein